MSKIIRDPEAFAKETYDLIIIGGGIYGIMLSYEASKRGLKSLLLEKSDFGGATTFNCLRILHGGLRYLQTLDLQRFRESVAERRWFLKNFPEFVEPLPCLMPLYGIGLRRPSILRMVSWINDTISFKRNEGVIAEKHLPNGKVISAEQTRSVCPSVDNNGLQGGLIWYDAFMPDSQRLVMKILRRACENKTFALNYIEAIELCKGEAGVTGVRAKDREYGKTYEYKSNIVINAAGPWCRDLAAAFDRDIPDLFKSSIAWNVVINKNPISSYATAVTPKKPDANTYFVIPWKGKLLAGTAHAPWFGNSDSPKPPDDLIQSFINDLNLAVPSLNLSMNDILYVFSGLLPVKKQGATNLTAHEVIFNHAKQGGPNGLYSVSGVKFTTARLVAEKTLAKIFPNRKVLKSVIDEDIVLASSDSTESGMIEFDWYPSQNDNGWRAALSKIIQNQSVQRLDDLIFRRTTLWENPVRTIQTASIICELFDWDDNRKHKEIERLKHYFPINKVRGT